LKSADGKLSVLYSRETDEFFAVATETKPYDNSDDENEEQSSLLQEASRLAHSVRVVYLYDACQIDRLLQVFEDDLMNTGTETVRSAPEAARNSHDSASTVRSPPKVAQNDSASMAHQSRSQAHHHTVSAEPSEDERTSQQSLPTEGGVAETERTSQQGLSTEGGGADPEIPDSGGVDVPTEEGGGESGDEEMPDDPPPGSGEGSPDVVSQREGGEVRTPEGTPSVF